jgi:putative ABC transport system permease protein
MRRRRPRPSSRSIDEIIVPARTSSAGRRTRRGPSSATCWPRSWGSRWATASPSRAASIPGDWEFNIDGIYTAARKSVDRSTLWFHWSYLNDSLPESRRDQIGWIVSRVDDPVHGADISAAVDKVFDEKDIQTTP